MNFLRHIKQQIGLQYLIGISTIVVISFICYLFIGTKGYHVVALLLLLAVSILAMFFEILPIVIIAVLSALIWNFFFIQPQSTFNISTPQDALLFTMYFVIAVMNAVFTSKIRKVENLARDRKEKAKTVELYNTLFNSLSHELKTPIATIIGSIDTLKENQDKLSDGNKIELYTEIDIAGHRLHRQVENLLNMSRLESDFLNLQLDWYDINEIVHSVIKNNYEKTGSHNICYNLEEGLPFFKIDGTLVEQILHNIIINAIQYTRAGTKVQISTLHKKGHCIIEITDNGPGFPPDKLAAVFDKFYRLPNSVTGGTGLGLSIAKGFAKAHNGNIYLTNNVGGGAKFIIDIPAEVTYPNTYEE